MNKILISFLIIFGLSQNVFAQSIINKIVAKVDSQVITQADLANAQRDFEKALQEIKDPQERERVRRENAGKTMQNLINAKLLDSELAQAKIDITSDEVQQAVQGVAYKQKKTMNQFSQALSSEGLNSQQVESNVREDLRKNKFLQQVIFPRIRISESDLQDYFSKHPNDFKTFGQIRFSQILLTPDLVSPGEDLATMTQNLVNQLRKGADFKTIAQRYSRGPFAANGGDSGPIEASTLRPDLLNFLLRLPANTISDPISVTNGFFIFKVTEKSNPRPTTFQESKNEIQQKLFESRVKEEIDKYIAEVRAKHYVEIMPN